MVISDILRGRVPSAPTSCDSTHGLRRAGQVGVPQTAVPLSTRAQKVSGGGEGGCAHRFLLLLEEGVPAKERRKRKGACAERRGQCAQFLQWYNY